MTTIHRYDAEGVWTINSIAMNRPAWALQRLTQLWVETDKRGQNRIIPGAVGVIDLPTRITETRFDFPLLVLGGCTAAGTELGCDDDQRETLVDNLDVIYNGLVVPTTALASSLTVFGQSARTGDVQVLGMREQRVKLNPRMSAWLGTLQVNLPDGHLA